MVISVAKSFAFRMIVGAKSARGRLSGTFHCGLHGERRFPEQGVVPFAANERKVLVPARLLEDNLGELLFGDSELLPGRDPFGLQEPLLDQFRPAGLDGEVRLAKAISCFWGSPFWAIR